MSDTKAEPRDATIDDVIEAMKQELEFERAHPEHERHFWMNDWLYTVDLTPEVRENPNQEPGWCKTAGCIAGTAMITQTRLREIPLFEWSEEDGQWLLRDDILELATNSPDVQHILGFSPDEADAFFYSENWPRRYANALTAEIVDNTDNLVTAIRLLELKRDGRLTVAKEYGVDSGYYFEWTIDGEVYSGVHH